MTHGISNVGYGALSNSQWVRLANITRLPSGVQNFEELKQQQMIEEIKAENITPKPIESVLPPQDKTFGLQSKEFMPEVKQNPKKLEKQYKDAILEAAKGNLLDKEG